MSHHDFNVFLLDEKTISYGIMKSPGLAAVLSLFFPGAGQVYNGRFLSALGWFMLAFFNWLLTLVLIGYLTAPVIHFLSAYVAYRQAERINRKVGGLAPF